MSLSLHLPAREQALAIAGAGGSGDRLRLRRRMAHHPVIWVIAVGLILAVVLVVGGWARMREQRRHVRELLRDAFKRRRGH
jgi:type VI protein secretion system component VasF